MATNGTEDIAGLREQILDNIRIAFPYFYKGSIPVDNIKFTIIVYAFGGTLLNTAEVLWGPHNKPFISSGAYDDVTSRTVLQDLLQASAQALSSLRNEGKLDEVYHLDSMQHLSEGRMLITELDDAVPARCRT